MFVSPGEERQVREEAGQTAFERVMVVGMESTSLRVFSRVVFEDKPDVLRRAITGGRTADVEPPRVVLESDAGKHRVRARLWCLFPERMNRSEDQVKQLVATTM